MQYSTTKLLDELNKIGICLSVEKDHDYLLELILSKSMELTHADAGSLYLSKDNQLHFEIVYNNSLNIFKGGKNKEQVGFPPLNIYDENGNPNKYMVVVWSIITGDTVNIENVYSDTDFDFSGAKKFDEATGYKSVSFLTVPMKDHEDKIIGVLQLINAIDQETKKIIPFSELSQQLIESLSSQAAVAITNKQLIESQRELFDSFIHLIAGAIDEKSPYTAGHCRRVPVLTNLIADAACNVHKGPLKEFYMSKEEKYELEVSAWLHDCGKITTPEYVMDKSTKLESICDRIEILDARFEIIKRDRQIEALIDIIKETDQGFNLDELLRNNQVLAAKMKAIKVAKEDIKRFNIGGEFMTDEQLQRIDEIANTYSWVDPNHKTVSILAADEVKNLKIRRGTLNDDERKIINNHVEVTIKMLESLPYPEHLAKIPEYAGGHHEKIDGTGYPNQLNGDNMSVPAKMLAIADVFEALTADDRPYKKAMNLSQALKILSNMKVDRHIDGDLFDVFMDQKVYMVYAEQYLSKDQIDEVNLDELDGYVPL